VVHCAYVDAIPFCSADPSRLAQTTVNLISNAMKF
jgi:signal transduction histidine kinase